MLQIRFFRSLHHQLCVRFVADSPGNDLSREQVQNNADVMKPLIRVDVGDIARPNAIGFLRIEVLLQDVPAGRIILFLLLL